MVQQMTFKPFGVRFHKTHLRGNATKAKFDRTTVLICSQLECRSMLQGRELDFRKDQRTSR